MKTIGNVIWFFLIGLWGAIICYIQALTCFVTIVFIPVGVQYCKLGGFYLWPMGKQVKEVSPSGWKKVINVVWLIVAGWENFLANAIIGLILFVTIIGIPFGKQFFKIAKFAALPLGNDFIYTK